MLGGLVTKQENVRHLILPDQNRSSRINMSKNHFMSMYKENIVCIKNQVLMVHLVIKYFACELSCCGHYHVFTEHIMKNVEFKKHSV